MHYLIQVLWSLKYGTLSCSFCSIMRRKKNSSTFLYCSSTVVSIPPPQAITTSHTLSYPTLVLSICPLYMFLKTVLLFPPLSPPLSPLIVVNLFSISMYLLYFACLFVLFIRFLLKVRSYGICLLPPALFHLA